VSVWLEGACYPTTADFLGKVLGVAMPLFYFGRADDVKLDPSVRALKVQMCDALGTRLFNMENDLLLGALGLHPMYKKIHEPGGTPQSAYAENGGKNVLTFFFRDLQKRMKKALLNTLERLHVGNEAPPPPSNPMDAPEAFFIFGYRHAVSNVSRPDSEIDSWFACSPRILRSNESVATFWESSESNQWPLLQRLAKPLLTGQGASAASERVWSAADDLCGGDRASTSMETLNARLILKMNTPVRASIQESSLFNALTRK
jgi:hypothetical protein